jgi:hypothetical protein
LVREHQVEDNEVWLATVDTGKGFMTVGGRFDEEALVGKIVADELKDIGFVINDEYAHHGRNSSMGDDRLSDWMGPTAFLFLSA